MSVERTMESALGALHSGDVERAMGQLHVARDQLLEGGDEAEGHGRISFSDERLKQAVARVDNALAVLEELAAAGGTDRDVEGHGRLQYSDERLKRAIAEVEDALAVLRELQAAPNE
jgi:hypothetical protein